MANVTIVLPVYNEEDKLERNTLKLLEFCKKNIRHPFEIVIADNNSKDKTREIAEKLSKKHKQINYLYINRKGRGIALKTAWKEYKADVNIYMDIDLATDLSALPRLIDEVVKGNNVVVGSRYLRNSKIKRTPFRMLISKVYNLMVRAMFKTRIKDMQCGFKAVDKKTVDNVIPRTEDTQFFFDTELILTAEAMHYKVKEIPVKWKEGKDTKVDFVRTITNYIKSLIKLRRRLKKMKL